MVKHLDGDYRLSRPDDASVDLTTFGGRLEWLVLRAGSGRPGDDGGRAAARALGLAEATINSSIKANSASFRTLSLLHRITGINLNWLICGDGEHGEFHWPTPAESVKERTRRSRSQPKPDRRTPSPKRNR